MAELNGPLQGSLLGGAESGAQESGDPPSGADIPAFDGLSVDVRGRLLAARRDPTP